MAIENIINSLSDFVDVLSGGKKRRADAVSDISRAYEEKFHEYHDKVENENKELHRVIRDVNMQMRNYDQLMGMDHRENYIDPVTGKIDETQEFNRNREIYKENLKDTGMPF